DTGGNARGVYVKDTIAYVADGNDGLRLINVSDPSNPTEIGFYDTWDIAFSVYVKDSVAYVADYGAGLRIINVSDPSNPTEIGFYDTSGYAYGVYAQDTIAYVADWNNGLRIINVSDPTNPVEIGFYDTGGFALGVYAQDTIAYVADGNDGLYIIYYYGNTGIKENKNRSGSNVYNIMVKMQDGLRIDYNIEGTKNASINIYNITGQKLYSNNSIKSPGQYSVRWNGNTGVYFVNIYIDKYIYTKKIIIIK
ncbi:T9SS type A sorting domain-containing protein, partial [candidate division WOR-3 bacterium]|nr:T9SS type A sorting domain-containing protein [candidate division WOR-3 bacterium]